MDERREFEKWVTAMEPEYAGSNLARFIGGGRGYRVHNVACWWMAWQGRAALGVSAVPVTTMYIGTLKPAQNGVVCCQGKVITIPVPVPQDVQSNASPETKTCPICDLPLTECHREAGTKRGWNAALAKVEEVVCDSKTIPRGMGVRVALDALIAELRRLRGDAPVVARGGGE